ncbi:hypothetical protein [Rhodobacter capsulatus]|uniref:hypothetical protein n=1 Tax=Rhodobacter capsulatus TaxID=1061 RepID=UPI0003D2AE86|nr:hypothetical protein [Rhodobacter capsulatus]ETD83418.1 hypothetical protein U716_09165 [Rhodobacter capsulatus B6]
MVGTTDKDIIAIGQAARSRLHYAERWRLMLFMGLLMWAAGSIYEGFLINSIAYDTLKDNDGKLTLAKWFVMWGLTLALPFAISKILHRFLMRRTPTDMNRIDNGLGVAAIISLLALPLLMAKANGVGLGNPLDMPTQPDGLVTGTYILAEWMRLPTVLILAAVAAFGRQQMAGALAFRREEHLYREQATAAEKAQDVFAKGVALEKSRKNRTGANRRNMTLGVAKGLNIAVEIKAKEYMDYARGASTVTSNFVDELDTMMKRGLAGFSPRIVELVEILVPKGIDFDALPANPSDLQPTDRQALIDHALWLRRTYSVANNLQGLTK